MALNALVGSFCHNQKIVGMKELTDLVAYARQTSTLPLRYLNIKDIALKSVSMHTLIN